MICGPKTGFFSHPRLVFTCAPSCDSSHSGIKIHNRDGMDFTLYGITFMAERDGSLANRKNLDNVITSRKERKI